MRITAIILFAAFVALSVSVGAQDAEREVPEATEATIRDGKRVFEQHCVLCHGGDGTGSPEILGQLAVDPPDLTDDEWTYGDSDADLFKVIAEGTPNDMEAFGAKIRERQIWHLIHYIRTLGAKNDIAAESDELVNPTPYSDESRAAGHQSYVRYCVECHGMDGRGHTEMVEFLATLPANLRKSVFKYGTDDATVFRVIKNGTPNDMPGFADKFTDEAIWDIVNYLKSIRED